MNVIKRDEELDKLRGLERVSKEIDPSISAVDLLSDARKKYEDEKSGEHN